MWRIPDAPLGDLPAGRAQPEPDREVQGMIRITQTNREINVSGAVDRLERGYSVKHEVTNYQHVRAPMLVQKPQIEDLNQLVIVHDLVEEYA